MPTLIATQKPHPMALGDRNVKVITCVYFKAMLISILAINARSSAVLPLCVKQQHHIEAEEVVGDTQSAIGFGTDSSSPKKY
jgi:hypothetical protein